MKKTFPRITLILLVSLFLTACEDEPKSPFEVTQAFWYAVENKNIDLIKKLVSEKSLGDEYLGDEYLPDNIVSVSEVSFGKIMIDGDIAEVETTLVVESDNPTTIPIDTLLVKENEKWKVDYHSTVGAIGSGGQLSQIIKDMKVFGEKFSMEFENSLNELDKAMPEIEKEISNMGEQIKEHVPEIKRQFEELAKKLQQALEESLAEEKQQDSI